MTSAGKPVFTATERRHLGAIADKTKRGLYLVGLLASRMQGTSLVVVGGFAVEFYTTGNYLTSDIDLVCMQAARVHELLAELGYAPDPSNRRHWLNPAHHLVVEVPGKALDHPDMYRRLSTIEIDGYEVQLLGIEDIIVNRLYSAINEKRDDDWHWAREMMAVHWSRLDLDYLTQQSAAQRIGPGLARLTKDVRTYLKKRIKHP